MFTPFLTKRLPLLPTPLLHSLASRFFSAEPPPILGYPLNIKKSPKNKLYPTIIPEYLSYDDFIMQVQMDYTKLDDYHNIKFKTPSGSRYNYWLPAFVNNDHFLRSQQYLFNSISIILNGVEGKEENDFKPDMVLKILPSILVKTTLNFLKGKINNDIPEIDAYIQVYILLARLVKMFPEIQRSIEQEIGDFYSNEENRKKTKDLEEFVIKQGLSSKGFGESDVVNVLLKEYLKRRMVKFIKKDESLTGKERFPGSLEDFIKENKLKNQLFLANIESVKFLIEKKGEEELLSEDVKKELQDKIERIKNSVGDNWETFIEGLGLAKFVSNENVMREYIDDAYKFADKKDSSL